MNKKIGFLLFFIFSFFSFVTLEAQIKTEKGDLVTKFDEGNKNFVNWAHLFYYAHFSREISIGKNDNFIQKSLFEQRKLVEQAREVIFKNVLKIDINNEITIKELLEISSKFQELLTRKVFDPQILLPAGQAGYKLNMGAFFSFSGMGNLIELILASGYFVEQEKLIPVKSKYLAYAYSRLIIDAGDADLKPALFPNIYTYDEKGNLILIYSLAHSNHGGIIQNGYVHYYKESKNLNLDNPKYYYCAALEVSGTKQTDIIISREDYLKFFASPISLKNLSEGHFFIVSSKKLKKK